MPDSSFPASKNTIPTEPKTRALVEARLRAAGLRVTAARVKILGALLSANCALSHNEIRTIVAIDRVTLYRVLSSLNDAGLAHKVTGDDRISRFGATASPGSVQAAEFDMHAGDSQNNRYRHGHFQCTLCSRMFCLEHDRKVGLLPDIFLRSNDGARSAAPEPLKKILQKTLGNGFKSHDIELIIKGWCADCAHRRPPSTPFIPPCL